MTEKNLSSLSQEEIKTMARQEAREVLARSSAFQAMSQEDKLNAYKDLVLANARKLEEQQVLSQQNGLSTELKKRGSQSADRASDLIDDKRHEHDIGRGVEAFDDLVDTINFPQFVKDLVKGVFDANMTVMKEQTDNYIMLMKEASKSAAQFIKQVSDADAMGHLAENNDDFNFAFDDEGEPQLTDGQGEAVDMDNNEVKAKIMDSKIAMAKEHRKILQQMIMMGITRMVVDKGVIKAGVSFDFKSKTNANFKDKAMNKYSKSSGTYGKFSGGLLGSIFGGPSAGRSSSTRSTSVSVSSANSNTKDELAAKLTGSVEIQFSTDYFELDKFVDLYQIEADEAKAKEENN